MTTAADSGIHRSKARYTDNDHEWPAVRIPDLPMTNRVNAMELVGPAAIEPATPGLENRLRTAFGSYDSSLFFGLWS